MGLKRPDGFQVKIGHILDPEIGAPRPTRRFMLPYSMAAAGSTVITTIHDLLTFARVHLDGGVAPNGQRVIAAESVERTMNAVTSLTRSPRKPSTLRAKGRDAPAASSQW